MTMIKAPLCPQCGDPEALWLAQDQNCYFDNEKGEFMLSEGNMHNVECNGCGYEMSMSSFWEMCTGDEVPEEPVKDPAKFVVVDKELLARVIEHATTAQSVYAEAQPGPAKKQDEEAARQIEDDITKLVLSTTDKVHAVVISHDCGTNLYVHLNPDTAKEEVVNFCLRWWDTEFEHAPPENPNEVMQMYFEKQHLEWAHIAEIPISAEAEDTTITVPV